MLLDMSAVFDNVDFTILLETKSRNLLEYEVMHTDG